MLSTLEASPHIDWRAIISFPTNHAEHACWLPCSRISVRSEEALRWQMVVCRSSFHCRAETVGGASLLAIPCLSHTHTILSLHAWKPVHPRHTADPNPNPLIMRKTDTVVMATVLE